MHFQKVPQINKSKGSEYNEVNILKNKLYSLLNINIPYFIFYIFYILYIFVYLYIISWLDLIGFRSFYFSLIFVNIHGLSAGASARRRRSPGANKMQGPACARCSNAARSTRSKPNQVQAITGHPWGRMMLAGLLGRWSVLPLKRADKHGNITPLERR